MKSLSPHSLVVALESGGDLKSEAISLSVDGMARPLQVANAPLNQPPAFFFSPGTSCTVWIPIPTNLVDRVESLSETGAFKGDQYPYVRLHLKPPSSAEAATIFSLWSATLPSDAPATDTNPAETFKSDFVLAGTFDRWKCARCCATNLALGIAVAAAVAALGPAIGASTAVSTLMAKFGLSEGVAIFAAGGASGAEIARRLCRGVC